MNANTLLAELGQKMNLPSLTFDDRGLSRLVFDQTLILDLEHDAANDQLHIYSVLGQVPADHKEKLFETLLNANLFCRETGGGTIAIDSLSNEILISRTIALDKTDSVDFQKILETFLDATEKCQEKMKLSGSSSEESLSYSFDPLSSAHLRA